MANPVKSLGDYVEELVESLGGIHGRVTATVNGTPLYDTDRLRDTGGATLKYDRWHMMLGSNSGAASYQTRRVTTYFPASGALVPDTGFGGDLLAGQEYLLFRQPHPLDLQIKLNDAITDLEYETEYAITSGTPGLRQFALASWITRPEQVISVDRRINQTFAQYQFQALPWWGVMRSEADLSLYVEPAVEASAVLRLRVLRPYSTLATWNATSSAPSEWVIPASKVKVLEMLMNGSTGSARQQYREQLSEARKDLRLAERTYRSRPARDIQFSSPGDLLTGS